MSSKVIIKKVDPNWKELLKHLPADLEDSAKRFGALLRHRAFGSASDLLHAILHYATALSLNSSALAMAALGVCSISRQALDKRLLASTPWLRHLLSQMLEALTSLPQGALGGFRLILVDASTISRPSSPGTEWRLHLFWRPIQQRLAGLLLTDAHQGEGLDKLDLQSGDLVIADRGYGLWRHLLVVLQAGAHFLIRVTWSNLPLRTLDGAAVDIIAWLNSLPAAQDQAERVVVARDDPEGRPLRLIASRLPLGKAEQARERVRRQARHDKREPNPNTLLAAGFCVLITNLPASYGVKELLQAYGIRWQIEWTFRRWKSLCELDRLPTYPSAIAEPVLLAKLLLILLMYFQMAEYPWEEWWTDEQPAPLVSTLVKATYDYIRGVLCPLEALKRILTDPSRYMRYLRSSRRKRRLQLEEAATSLVNLLSGLQHLIPGGLS